jgi:hypothetical protein
MPDLRALQQKVALLWPHLDERARRLFAASEARELGHGGVSTVSRACGLSRVTITKGLRELESSPLPAGRVGFGARAADDRHLKCSIPTYRVGWRLSSSL